MEGTTVKMIKDISNFPEMVRRHAIGMMTAFGVFEYDENANAIAFSADAQAIRSQLSKKYQLVPMWVSFSVGVECLFKAVLCKHQCLVVSRGKVSSRAAELNRAAPNFPAAKRVYDGVNAITVSVGSFHWLKRRVDSQQG